MSFLTLQDTPYREARALRLSELLRRQQALHREIISPRCGPWNPGALLSAVWAQPCARGASLIQPSSPREQLWAVLRAAGFSEFTERLAHFVGDDHIRVVEIAAIAKDERKARQIPEGLFRIGVGVFWPTLAEAGVFRCNKLGFGRPKVNECHISDWLTPQLPVHDAARSVFASTEDARAAIGYALERWFPTFTNFSTLASLLQQDDMELYCAFPMLRGLGGKDSVRRLGLLAHCTAMRGFHQEAREYLALAESALDRTSDNMKDRSQDWMGVVKAFTEVARCQDRVKPARLYR